MKFLMQKSGSVLPTVLVAVIVLELILVMSLQLYQNRFYTYQMLINHYQSQSLLFMSEHLLTSAIGQPASRRKGVLQYNVGQVSFSTTDNQSWKLTCRLLNGYEEEHTFKKADSGESSSMGQ